VQNQARIQISFKCLVNAAAAVSDKTLRSVGRELQMTAQETAKSMALRTVHVHWTTSFWVFADLRCCLLAKDETSMTLHNDEHDQPDTVAPPCSGIWHDHITS